MALFKISKGNEANLPKNAVEGHAYFTVDEGKGTTFNIILPIKR